MWKEIRGYYEDLLRYDRTSKYKPGHFKVGQKVKIRIMQGERKGIVLDTNFIRYKKPLLELKVEGQKRRYSYSHILNAEIWQDAT